MILFVLTGAVVLASRPVSSWLPSTLSSLSPIPFSSAPAADICDGRSRSEIVVPVFDRDGQLIAVFDVDSAEPAAFDDRDRAGLERVLAYFAR